MQSMWSWAREEMSHGNSHKSSAWETEGVLRALWLPNWIQARFERPHEDHPWRKVVPVQGMQLHIKEPLKPEYSHDKAQVQGEHVDNTEDKNSVFKVRLWIWINKSDEETCPWRSFETWMIFKQPNNHPQRYLDLEKYRNPNDNTDIIWLGNYLGKTSSLWFAVICQHNVSAKFKRCFDKNWAIIFWNIKWLGVWSSVKSRR